MDNKYRWGQALCFILINASNFYSYPSSNVDAVLFLLEITRRSFMHEFCSRSVYYYIIGEKQTHDLIVSSSLLLILLLLFPL